MPRPVGRTVVLVVERVLLLGGLLFFGVLLYQLGITTILANLRAVGWGIVAIVLQEVLAYVANTLGWRAAFAACHRPPPFGRLMAARMAGDAVNYLAPTATLGGEFVRTRMLLGHAPGTAIVASLAVARLTQTIGLFAFLAVGLLFVVDQTRLSSRVKWGLLAGLGAFAVVLGILLFLQRRGMFSGALRLAERWPTRAMVSRLRTSVERLDREVARVHTESVWPVIASSASFFVGWTLGAVESYLILWFLESSTEFASCSGPRWASASSTTIVGGNAGGPPFPRRRTGTASSLADEGGYRE